MSEKQIDIEEYIAKSLGKDAPAIPQRAKAPGSLEERYAPLMAVLTKAYLQSATGKGDERHAEGQPFLQQPIMEIARRNGIGFQIGQAEKKTGEATGMLMRGLPNAAKAELLGAIVYLAAAYILIEEKY